MTAQDRDALACCLIGGTAMLLCLTGLGWVAVRLYSLIPMKIGV